MARVQVGYDPRAEALQTTAAPNIKTEQARFDPRASTAFQLAEAVAKAQPVIDKFNEDYERKKIQEQILKKDYYVSEFSKNRTDGDVTAVQLGQKFPEMVPIIRAQVTQALGEEDGKKFAQPILDGILKDENLRTNTEARASHLTAKRNEFIGGLKGDDFYKAGAIRRYDAEVGQYENRLQAETAAKHIELLTDKYSSEVEKAFANQNPKAALEALDSTWKSNNGLSNETRNKAAIATATRLAFAADRPDILDQVPERFLNAETKAQIQKTKNQIQENRISKYTFERRYAADQREEAVRKQKVEIIGQIARGEQVDPTKYTGDDTVFKFAMEMKDAGRVPDVQSVGAAQQVRTAIVNGATMRGMDEKQVINQIMALPGVNPKEKQALIQEVPRLLEGQIAMNDPMVKSAMDTRLDARLKFLESSTNSRIQSLVAGRNLRSEVVRSFDVGVRNSLQAYYDDNNKWPTGRAKQDIVDREVQRAEQLLESLTSLQSLSQQNATPGAAPAASQPPRSNVTSGRLTNPGTPAAPAPVPAARAQPTQADIDFAKKNPQFRQRFIDTFGREP